MILQKYVNSRLKIVYQEDKTETIYGVLIGFDDNYLELELDSGKPQLIPREKVYKIIPQNYKKDD